MTDNDLAIGGGEDAFTPEEQAAFEAYERGGETAASDGLTPPAAEPAPAAAEPPAAEPDEEGAKPEGAPEAQPRDEKGKFVPHGALHEERERRKAVEKERDELRERFARGDERLRILSEAMQRPATPAQPASEPVKVPDPAEDIFGYAKHLEQQIEALRTGQTQLTESQKKAEETRRANDERNEVIGFYQQDLRTAIQADASVADAYEHLFAGRVAELTLFGMDQKAAIEAVREEEFNLAQTARQRGTSPSAMIAALAKSRGFAPKAPEPAPAPAAAPQESAADKAARAAAGQAGPGRSLSAAGGQPAGEITLETLSSMSEADFERLMTSNPARVRALMGG
ncbi:hypothetical protein ASG32_02800 [Methylobacterium sp. Leaf361]|uniref:hypothetical protein n=1 Tax=Methylobacterium sp. Leaf361 TaxID=1736352 RepID=UPI0006FCF548|nr:hypothetical protein [Methylobacterium sp. Leaf361]KQS81697.1 hypothetical protein ASG32_02800 [Methylobacterium sp. Leaf361]